MRTFCSSKTSSWKNYPNNQPESGGGTKPPLPDIPKLKHLKPERCGFQVQMISGGFAGASRRAVVICLDAVE
jgi:hypothetical protein